MAEATTRLPPTKASQWLFSGPTGYLFARTWFDRWTYRLLATRLFPASRLWAAATVAEGCVDRFREEGQLDRLEPGEMDLARELMRRTVAAADAKFAAADRWQETFYAATRPGDATLVAAEVARRAAANAFLARRLEFRPLTRGRKVGLVRFETRSEEQAEAVYGDWLADPDSAYPAPDPAPAVELSHAVDGPHGRVSWLRLRSAGRAVDDIAWARIVEPEGARNAPTVLYCHGLGEETELRGRFLDETLPLIDLGVRVIRLEAPWHNRRFLRGRWSGEPFLGNAPLGPVEHFEAHLREIATLVGWCRERYGTPVAIGGLSMGALTAALAAYRAGAWPADMRPDALFLAAVSEDMREICFDGAIGRIVGIAAVIRACGWRDESLERVRRLTNPTGAPVMDPSRIVVKLGRTDDVMPYASGRRLVERWRVPSENVFERTQGHFTVPISMVRNHRALKRFADILHRL